MAEETGQPAEAAPEAPPTAPPEAPPETPPATALEDPGAGPAPGPAAWPDDWRERAAKNFAGKDAGEQYDKELERLKRLHSVEDMWRSYRHMEQRQSRGPEPFPADGTDEQKAEWRKTNGIPADGYKLDGLDLGGLEIGEDDKKAVEAYLEMAHDGNDAPDRVKATLNWYFDLREQLTQERTQKDNQARLTARDELRDEYGPEFQTNLAVAHALVANAPEEVRENIMAARLPNGNLLGNDAEVLRWLVSMAKEVNPAATVLPGGAGDAMKGIDDRIAEIEKFIAEKRDEYHAPANKPMRDEYLRLLEAKEKIDAKGRAA